MWRELVEVANDLPKKDRKLENDHYRVYVKEYDKRRAHGAVTRLMVVHKGEPFDTRWADYQRIKNEVCGPDREGVEFYPRDRDLRDHGNGYHIWVLPEGQSLDLGFSTPKRPLRIYIDAGAHTGVTVQTAALSGLYDRIFAFEPSAECRAHPRWADLQGHHDNISLISSAVWHEDTTLDWYTVPEKPLSQSASVMREKTTGGIATALKMDIEGAEFDVLEHLIATQTISLIDTLTIEWHATKLDGEGWQIRKNRILAGLSALGIEVYKLSESDE